MIKDLKQFIHRFAIIISTLFFLLLMGACKSIRSIQIPAFVIGSNLGDTRVRPVDDKLMLFVPAGEFEMGIDDEMLKEAKQLCKDFLGDLALTICRNSAFRNEQPVHTVELDSFWIDKTEITNDQYRMCVEAGACIPPVETGSFSRESYFEDHAYGDFPVIYVNWTMASTYCAWVGARLPTEAEWEYSARGPNHFVFPWGNEFDKTKLNYCDLSCKGVSDESFDDGFSDTAPVGSFPEGRSWVGALDMAGNVREWVHDWFAPYPNEKVRNPAGPDNGVSKIPRGGSWYDTPDDTRSTNRGENLPDYSRHKVGFRCAVSQISE